MYMTTDDPRMIGLAENPDPPEWTESEEPAAVAVCDNCGETIREGDDMAVFEEHTCTGRPGIKHVCAGCWEGNGWDKAEELLDLAGIWYWTGDAAEAVKIAGEHLLKEQARYKRMLDTAANIALQSIGKVAAV